MTAGPMNPGQTFEVALPAGGKLYLQSAEEVDLWNQTHERYAEDYGLTNFNDLHTLGAILQQQVMLYRSQFLINGMEPELDSSGVPTGRYVQSKRSAEDMHSAQKMMNSATDEIRKLEKSLGLLKEQRESGGAMSLQNYVRMLKRAAHERGIHITRRLTAYEAFVNDLSTRLRILANADPEDQAYHDITPEKICGWAREQMLELQSIDKEFAAEKGALYVGKL